MNVLERLRNAKDTKVFEYELYGEIAEVEIKRFLPGTASRKNKTALIKMYTQSKSNVDEGTSLRELSQEEFDNFIDRGNLNDDELNQDFIECVVGIRFPDNPDEVAEVISKEDADDIFTREFKTECVSWALEGATPRDEDNPSEVDQFPDVPDGQGESNVS